MEDLNKYNFSTRTGFNSVLLRLRYERLSGYFVGKNCLELGCADGEGTKMLLDHFKKIVAVDGSSDLLQKAREEIADSKVQFVHSYFEELQLDEKYETIILAHILEHVDDPVGLLRIAKSFLAPGGVVIIDVPNALSIHRQVGVLMGMIDSEYQLNEADLSIGHKRVYDLQTLKKDIESSGLKVLKSGGLFIKPFSNSQMEQLLDKKGIQAFNEVGKRYPEISAEIFAICH